MPWTALADHGSSMPTRALNLPAMSLPPPTLKANGIAISMDGRGRCQDNIFIERLWWMLKYQYLYLHSFDTGGKLRSGLKAVG
jgi:transposase InsO family protein